jgi:uncharacterized peroxidase-related enzyme
MLHKHQFFVQNIKNIAILNYLNTNAEINMTRLSTDFTPTPEAAKTLDTVKQQMGMVPNVFKIMAQAPSVLNGYLAFNASLAKGTLSKQEREQIALAVSGYDKCTYCASAHTALAQKLGITSDETKLNLQGKGDSPKIAELLNFSVEVMKTKGNVADNDMQKIRAAGYSDSQIVEIVAVIAGTIFTNYFNHVAGTEVDFPLVKAD